MKKLILTLVFVFVMVFPSNASFSINSLRKTCFEYADEIAAYEGRKWNLSTEEEFHVFEKYFWSCQLRRSMGWEQE